MTEPTRPQDDCGGCGKCWSCTPTILRALAGEATPPMTLKLQPKGPDGFGLRVKVGLGATGIAYLGFIAFIAAVITGPGTFLHVGIVGVSVPVGALILLPSAVVALICHRGTQRTFEG